MGFSIEIWSSELAQIQRGVVIRQSAGGTVSGVLYLHNLDRTLY